MRALAAAFLVVCTAANAGEPAWPKTDGLPLITSQNAGRLHLAGQLGSPQYEDLQWSFDGRRLGLRSAEGIRIHGCDPNQGARLTRGPILQGERMPVGFCFSSREDGAFTCDGGREITLWDLRSGQSKEAVRDAGAGVKALAFSPTAPLLAAVTDDGKVRIWRDDSRSGPPRILRDHPAGAAGLSIDAKGKYAVTWAGWDDANVWELSSGELVTQVTSRTANSSGILSPAVISFDGELWANTPRNTLRWELPSAKPLPPSAFKALLGPGCFHRDGRRYLSLSFSKGADPVATLNIATIGDGKSVKKVIESPRVAAASFEPSHGRLLAAITASRLSLHDAASGAQLFSEPLGNPVTSIGISCEKTSALCTTTGSDLHLIDLQKGGKGTPLALGGEARPWTALLHERTKLVIALTSSSGGEGSKVSAWKLTGSALKRLPLLDKEPGKVTAFSIDPRGDLLALGTDSGPIPQVKLIPLDTGKLRSTIKRPAGGPGSAFIRSLEFDPSGKLLAAVISGGGPFLIDVDQGRIASTFELPDGFDSWLAGARFSPDGALLAAPAFKDLVLLYDVKTGKVKKQLKVEGQLQRKVDFSPGGGLLVCAVERRSGWKTISEIALLDVGSGDTLARLPAHTQSLVDLEFLPKGNAIVSSARDGSIRIWAIAGAEARKKMPEGK